VETLMRRSYKTLTKRLRNPYSPPASRRGPREGKWRTQNPDKNVRKTACRTDRTRRRPCRSATASAAVLGGHGGVGPPKVPNMTGSSLR
jgi:hypothetical protein